jgi:hypothetical protein
MCLYTQLVRSLVCAEKGAGEVGGDDSGKNTDREEGREGGELGEEEEILR